MDMHFVAGLPRSGSTLLMNVLAQNPQFHATPTNGLLDMFCQIHNNWHKNEEFQSQGLNKVQPRIQKAVKGLLRGFFEEELSQGKTIFDKNRAWLHYIEELEYVLERRVYIIAPVRDPREIAASFEKVYRRRKNDWRHGGEGCNEQTYLQTQTVEGRCAQWFSPGGVAGLAYSRLRDAFARGFGDRILILPFDYFTKNPQQSLDQIHGLLGYNSFDYNFDNIKQLIYEDDCYHGMDLHVIGNKVEPKTSDWNKILPEKVTTEIEHAYGDIVKIAAGDNPW